MSLAQNHIQLRIITIQVISSLYSAWCTHIMFVQMVEGGMFWIHTTVSLTKSSSVIRIMIRTIAASDLLIVFCYNVHKSCRQQNAVIDCIHFWHIAVVIVVESVRWSIHQYDGASIGTASILWKIAFHFWAFIPRLKEVILLRKYKTKEMLCCVKPIPAQRIAQLKTQTGKLS